MDSALRPLTTHGFAVVPAVLDQHACKRLVDLLPLPERAGSRRLLQHPWCAALASTLSHHPQLAPTLPPDAMVVQCTLFSKSPDSNWLVSLHQDRSIPVRNRITDPRLTGWSDKEGELFVQPPAETLAQLTAIRIHLDPCGPDKGALRVVPGSHNQGILDLAQGRVQRELHGEQTVSVPLGGALIMKPLLLHASSKSRAAAPRRVLHFVFGPRHLPCGLEWPQV